MTEKAFYAPFGGAADWDADEREEASPDPYDRPDRCAEQADEAPYLWPYPGAPTEPCPCCGADIPENPSPGYICPTCWWEIDLFTADEHEPSDQNHGLSLIEARMNFRAFGICDPSLWHEGN